MKREETMKTAPAAGKRRRRWLALAAAIFMVPAVLSGCGSVPLSVTGGGGCYTMPQTMMIVTTERNRYEEVYTDVIWDADADGETFDRYLLSQIQAFLENMREMNLLADQRSVELSAGDRESMGQAAQEYFEALSAADREALGITLEDARLMYEEYCLANQLVESLTEDMSLEVSDNEARVAVIREARTSDQEAAQAAAVALAADGTDFDRAMAEAGLEVKERSLGRGESSPAYEEAVFALEEGQIGNALTDGEDTCFVQSVTPYDREATEVRKQQIYAERKRGAFRQIFEQFGERVKAAYPDGFFDGISFDGEKTASEADFFEIYKKYMGEASTGQTPS